MTDRKMCANCFWGNVFGLAGYKHCKDCNYHSKWEPMSKEQHKRAEQERSERKKRYSI